MTSEARLYVITAFAFNSLLILHFALRKWAFDKYIFQYGWLFYVMAIPAAVVSVILLRRGAPWWMWTGGFLYLIWAIFGYLVEFKLGYASWRNPIQWSILIPYLLLYLSTNMFYWWPVLRVSKPLWIVFTVLFVLSSILNAISH
ncbi:MAG: hypothetical protein JXA25_17525 [Anaerolineales bacterium]|nr:hypothetical protein [Anaerolineales bacterium]